MALGEGAATIVAAANRLFLAVNEEEFRPTLGTEKRVGVRRHVRIENGSHCHLLRVALCMAGLPIDSIESHCSMLRIDYPTTGVERC